MLSGKTKVCGIIANPVEHSMSPLLQNFYAEKTGIDFVYVPFKVEDEAVEAAVKGAYALNMVGMNVTIPHKQQVMKYLKSVDGDAKAIGAVNTLVRIEGGFKGYNTDAAGLLRAIAEAGIVPRDESCILLGAGGAAKAVAYTLAKVGAKEVYLLNRNEIKARHLADDINRLAGRKLVIPMSILDYKKIPDKSYLAFQSTSVGMHPDVDFAPVEDEEFYEKIHTGVDLIYTPMETKFMKYVTAAGAKAMNGLDMLLYQGIIAYELWNPEITVEEDVIKEARELLKKQLEESRT